MPWFPGLVFGLGASTCLYKLVGLVRVEPCWCWNVGFAACKLVILRSFHRGSFDFACLAPVPPSIARNLSIFLWWIHLLSTPNPCSSGGTYHPSTCSAGHMTLICAIEVVIDLEIGPWLSLAQQEPVPVILPELLGKRHGCYSVVVASLGDGSLLPLAAIFATKWEEPDMN